MAKLYKVNMNIDTTNVSKFLMNNKKKPVASKLGEFEQYTAPEYFKDICMQAISIAHTIGAYAVLRRTLKISELFDGAINADGILVLQEEDYKYVLSSLNKADKWNNQLDIAQSLAPVFDAIQKAEVVE